MKKIFILSIILIITNFAQSQNIIRKGYLGIRGIENNDSVANSRNLNINYGVIVTEILPNSTAENLGIIREDIVVKINSKEIKDLKSLRAISTGLKSKEKIEIYIIRNNDELILNGEVAPLPFEKSEDYEIIYDEVKFKDGYIRIIINKPFGNQKFKSIFFIPGYTCFSLDNLGKHPYGQLIDGLCKRGYIVFRSEKPGIGDNTNTPACSEIDYITELEAFEVAYNKLKTYDFVDKNNLFIFGHSLGGYEAPMIAARNGAKGVIVCGTGVKSWFEYIIEMFRFQNIIAGADYVENEKFIFEVIPLLFDYLIKKIPPLQLSENADYKKLLFDWFEYDGNEHIWSRNYKYWQQIQDLNMPEIWKGVSGKVLVIRGEADYQAFSDNDHKMIADIVNFYNPQNAKFILIPNMDHGFAKSKTPEESYKNSQIKGYYYENFNPIIIDIVDDWIQSLD